MFGVLVWLLVLAFIGVAARRWWWCRDLGDEPAFPTEDDPRWRRMFLFGEVD